MNPGHDSALRTGDGRPLPPRLKAELLREIELIELLLLQIAEVETERDSVARRRRRGTEIVAPWNLT